MRAAYVPASTRRHTRKSGRSRVPFRNCVSASSRAEDRLFDRERPIEVFRVDRDLERAWILGRVSRALSRTLFVNSLLEIASADGALKDQPEGSGPLEGSRYSCASASAARRSARRTIRSARSHVRTTRRDSSSPRLPRAQVWPAALHRRLSGARPQGVRSRCDGSPSGVRAANWPTSRIVAWSISRFFRPSWHLTLAIALRVPWRYVLQPLRA